MIAEKVNLPQELTERGEESLWLQKIRLRPNHYQTPQSVPSPKEVLNEDPTVEIAVKTNGG